MAKIIGTTGNDILNGGIFDDVIVGYAGDDVIADPSGSNDVNVSCCSRN